MAAKISDATSHDVKVETHCYVTMFPKDDKVDWDNPVFAYKASLDPDTHYFHQAMKEQDKEEFENNITKEVEDQYNNGNFLIVHKSKVPDDQIVLPAVWQMRRRRDAITGAIKMYKEEGKAKYQWISNAKRGALLYDASPSCVVELC